MDPFLGEIRIFAGTFVPRNWAACNGQLLPINSNQALFALLGTFYGGDGRTNFALPNLQGRSPLGWNDSGAPGVSPNTLGESGGASSVTLTSLQLPPHVHTGRLRVDSGPGNLPSPVGAVLATEGTGQNAFYAAPTGNETMRNGAATSAAPGNSQPHENMPPFLVVQYIIATQGLFPPRS